MLIPAHVIVGLEILFSNQKFSFQNSKHIVQARWYVDFFHIYKTQEESVPSESINYLGNLTLFLAPVES